MKNLFSTTLFCFIVGLVLSLATAQIQAKVLTRTSKELKKTKEIQRLVADVCHKSVVLLGEDSGHGVGETLNIKSELVQILIDECGFSALMFESPIYDFMDLERALSAQSATSEQLADAIGGLWSMTKESDLLVSYLFEKARQSQLSLFGYDFQLGGATQLYAQTRLAEELTSYLHGLNAQQCQIEISRLSNWQYDEMTPFDEIRRKSLRICAEQIQRAVQKQNSGPSSSAALMANNFFRFVTALSEQGVDADQRELAMRDNIVALRSRLPKNTKIIIWGATVHAQKLRTITQTKNLAMDTIKLSDRDMAVIGFSALSGSHGRPKKSPTILVSAPEDSLEAKIFVGDKLSQLRYVDHDQLKSLGSVSARAKNLSSFEVNNWSQLLDGLIVLREERPPEYTRGAKPRQLKQ
ncbi:MAG: erythromycin esterase family protein [Undibacterium sp.]|nr:erythromycin esterase family protein [Undibacterium sp.]